MRALAVVVTLRTSAMAGVVRDGSSLERAVLVRGLSTDEAIRRQWDWIAKFHPTATV